MVISSDCGFWRGSKSWNRFVYFCSTVCLLFQYILFTLFLKKPFFLGTALEQLIQKLMEEDGNPQSVIWRHPLMTYSKDPISTSLTTFTSEELQNEALKLFKVIYKLAHFENSSSCFLLLYAMTIKGIWIYLNNCHFLVCAS